MEILEINAEERGTKKGDAGRILKTGKIPAIIYGEKQTPAAIAVSTKEILKYLNKGGESSVYQVNFKKDKINSIIREIKTDPVKDNIIHIDFLRIDLNKPIQTEVPVNIIGESKGVKLGGVLEVRLHDIEIECLPMDIPRAIDVDVSELEIGDALHISNLKIDEKIKILNEAERTVVVVSAPTKEEVPVAEEAAEGAEGAAGAEGAEKGGAEKDKAKAKDTEKGKEASKDKK